ncbi:hypothetical protein C8J56DRAFT_445096 [Mycena floridula]|nr:hypothetical protein C8J56DRAFT_445096 [Mycena floridula]
MSLFNNTTPMLGLTAVAGGFGFKTKYIPLPAAIKMTLGSQICESSSGQAQRVAQTINGWFEPKISQSNIPVSPLSLSTFHAEVWVEDGKVYISDLQSAFGTFLNGEKIDKVTLKTGDVITLGIHIRRNANTPSYISEDHLLPVVAKVSIYGL